MKLVRFDGGKTGLMVELPSGPHVLDVVGRHQDRPDPGMSGLYGSLEAAPTAAVATAAIASVLRLRQMDFMSLSFSR
jgi:hypothetical protein